MEKAEREVVDTLIISDIHFWSDLCRAKALRKMLDLFECRRVIVNGDAFDHLKIGFSARIRYELQNKPYNEGKRRLKKSHFDVLKRLSGMAKPENNCEEIMVEGNHDAGLAEFLGCLVGMLVYQEFTWEYQGERFLAIHGDQFDQFYSNHWLFSEIVTWIYQIYQGLGSWTHPVCKILKHKAKQYTRAFDLVAHHAIAYAKKRGVKHIMCGHTHMAEHREVDGIHYYNSGSWTEVPCSCITIDPAGIKLRYFSEGGEQIEVVECYTFPNAKNDKIHSEARLVEA